MVVALAAAALDIRSLLLPPGPRSSAGAAKEVTFTKEASRPAADGACCQGALQMQSMQRCPSEPQIAARTE